MEAATEKLTNTPVHTRNSALKRATITWELAIVASLNRIPECHIDDRHEGEACSGDIQNQCMMASEQIVAGAGEEIAVAKHAKLHLSECALIHRKLALDESSASARCRAESAGHAPRVAVPQPASNRRY